MILHHLVLDTPTLAALSGSRQVSALIHRAHFEPETRLWVPVLPALEADRECPGIAEHIGSWRSSTPWIWTTLPCSR